jgi:hypothetical protein
MITHRTRNVALRALLAAQVLLLPQAWAGIKSASLKVASMSFVPIAKLRAAAMARCSAMAST